jgi:anti-sigma factor RsiW
MNEHVTEAALRRAMSGEAESNAKLAVLRHLASCEVCAAIGRRVAQDDLLALSSHFADPDAELLGGHLDDATQLRPYLGRRRLDAAESEIVASHLDDCERCRARLEAMHAARHRRARIYAIAASVAVAAALSSVVIMTREPAQRPPVAIRRQPTPPPQLTMTAATTTTPATTTTATVTTPIEIDPEWQRLVARAVEKRKLPFPAVLATLSMPADVSRGSGVETERVYPEGVILEEARPHFSWPAKKSATYVVFVFDGEREVTQSEPLRGNEWTPATDLPRGRTLAWQVEVRGDGETSIIPSPPAPPALFRIIPSNEARDLARAKTLHGQDPLLLAVLYARSGLRDAALEQLRLAAKKGNPGAEQIVRDLDHN